MRRREFLMKTFAATAAGAVGSVGLTPSGRADGETRHDQLPRRSYGKTDIELSIIGLGGIVVAQTEQPAANDTVAWAIDQGVNYFDVAPSYGDAEDHLGPALEPYRDRSFLACKTAQRDAENAQRELEQSLKKLRTDHFDLYQVHGLQSLEEAEKVLAPGGAMEVFIRARERGDVRHLGFSSHSVEAALKMLDEFAFDSVLFPFNCVCAMNGGFGPSVIEKAQEKGAALLALKTLAWTPWPEGAEHTYPKCWYQPIDDVDRARLALRYTLSLGGADRPAITAAVPPGDDRLFRLAVEIGLGYEPLDEEGHAALQRELAGVEPIFRMV